MGTVIGGNPEGIYLLQDTKGRTYIKGLYETRKKFLQMSGDRNLFDKWMKEAIMIAAREATRTAPVQSGALAATVRGWASKTVDIKSRQTGLVSKKFLYGGVITAGSARDRKGEDGATFTTGVQYGRSTSLGMYHIAGQKSKSGNRIWRHTVRGRGNPYLVRAREKKKGLMVDLLNYRLAQYIKIKGFEPGTGF